MLHNLVWLCNSTSLSTWLSISSSELQGLKKCLLQQLITPHPITSNHNTEGDLKKNYMKQCTIGIEVCTKLYTALNCKRKKKIYRIITVWNRFIWWKLSWSKLHFFRCCLDFVHYFTCSHMAVFFRNNS